MGQEQSQDKSSNESNNLSNESNNLSNESKDIFNKLKSDKLSDNLNYDSKSNLGSEIKSQTEKLGSELSSISSDLGEDKGSLFSSVLFWIGIIILLLFLGYNVFDYLGEAGDYLRKLFAPILSFFGVSLGEASKQTVKMSSEGSKGIIDTIASGTTSGINFLESHLTNAPSSITKSSDSKATPSTSQTTPSTSQTTPSTSQTTPSTSQTTPSTSSSSQSQKASNKQVDSEPEGPLESIPLNNNKGGKTQYCYIGSENAIRSCISVKSVDECLSGEIFPTKNMCINPSLRN